MIINGIKNQSTYANKLYRDKNSTDKVFQQPINEYPSQELNYNSTIFKNNIIAFGQKGGIDKQRQNIIDANLTVFLLQEHASQEKIRLFENFLGKRNDSSVEVEKIIQGGEGSIYKVNDVKTGLTVMVKAQHSEEDGYDVNVAGNGTKKVNPESCNNEVSSIRKLSDNTGFTDIIAYAKSDNENHIRAFAMELIDGNILELNSVFIKPPMLKALYENISRLDEARVYHRDISARNVILGKDGLSIIDFGFAKPFEEMHRLNSSENPENLKYQFMTNTALSNMDNFESLALIPYLKSIRGIVSSQKDFMGIPDFLLQQHVMLKSDYHKRNVDRLLRNKDLPDSNTTVIENEEILSRVFSRIKPGKVDETLSQQDEQTLDICNVELLKMKIPQAQKASRLYCDESHSNQNYPLALNWLNEMGLYIKRLKKLIIDSKEKYADDNDMIKYLNIREEFADFYMNKVFAAIYPELSEKVLEFITSSTPKSYEDVKFVVDSDGGTRVGREAQILSSNYVTLPSNNKGIFPF